MPLKCRPDPQTHCANGHIYAVAGRMLANGQYYCMECQKIRTIRYRNNPKNRKRVLEWQKISNRRGRYSVEPDQLLYMIREQEERCAICKDFLPSNTYKICIDHDHKTKKIRGLLCRPCNLGLGHLKDDLYRVKNAVKYLEGHRVL